MFGALLRYRDEEFYRLHPSIRFDTLQEFGRYQIAIVFLTSAEAADPEAIDYTAAHSLASEDAFADFIRRCQSQELYATGIPLSAQDRLLILSTCEYSVENGRIVVIAKKI